VGLNISYGPSYTKDILEKMTYPFILVNQYLLILLPVLIYALGKKLNFKEVFRLNKPGLVPCLLIIAMSVPAYFVALMLNTLVLYVLQFLGSIPSQSIPVPQNIGELMQGIFYIGITPAICEEMMHRGLMLSAYEKRGTTKAIIFTSILFGIFHFDITNFLGPVFLGLIISYYVVRTNSIFAGMLAHFLNNAIAELIQYFYRSEAETEIITITANDMLVFILYGMVSLIILSILLFLFRKYTKGRYIFRAPISNIKSDIKSVFTHWPIVSVVLLYIATGIITILTIMVD